MNTIDEIMAAHRKVAEASYKDATQKTEERFQAAALLASEGIEVSLDQWACRHAYSVRLKEVKDISKVVRAIGPVKPEGSFIEDAEKRLVAKTFVSVKFPSVKVMVTLQLPDPRSKNGKKTRCKIVRRRITTAELVCDIVGE